MKGFVRRVRCRDGFIMSRGYALILACDGDERSSSIRIVQIMFRFAHWGNKSWDFIDGLDFIVIHYILFISVRAKPGSERWL